MSTNQTRQVSDSENIETVKRIFAVAELLAKAINKQEKSDQSLQASSEKHSH